MDYSKKRFYPDDIKLPMLLIGGSDLFYNLVVYFFMFLLRGRFSIFVLSEVNYHT